MNTYMHLWQYLAEILEWGVFQKKVVDKIKTRILCWITFFRKGAVYEVMWKNMVGPDRLHMTSYGAEKMRFACRITKARTQTHTHNF
jgi:hypothetical protein